MGPINNGEIVFKLNYMEYSYVIQIHYVLCEFVNFNVTVHLFLNYNEFFSIRFFVLINENESDILQCFI